MEQERNITASNDSHIVNNEMIQTEQNAAAGELKNSTEETIPMENFKSMDLETITKHVSEYMKNYPVLQLKKIMDSAMEAFDSLYSEEFNKVERLEEEEPDDEARKKKIALLQQIKERFAGVMRQYRDLRQSEIKKNEEEKESNLKQKLAIIEELKDIMKKEESLNNTFQEFRTLQDKWRTIGLVPQAQAHNLLETYHHHIEQFYNYIKINKELRDLDLKKNLTEKEALCQEAEKLIDVEDRGQAFKQLQLLHNRWKEVGPVAKELKDELWNRFKTASDKINEEHSNFFETLKKEQETNLIAKQEICDKVEKIATKTYSTPKEWQNASAKIIELQEEWRHTGTVPQKDRTRIFKQFRELCDAFFNSKRDFTKGLDVEQEANYLKKVKLCEKVEALKDSEEWKTTTDKIISYQREWKKIGPAPRKVSNKVWNRFRAACDAFFTRKAEFHKDIDAEQEANLAAKRALVDEVVQFTLTDDNEQNIATLKNFQTRWAGIGFVPMKAKNEIQEAFRDAINNHFSKLNLDEFNKDLERFRAKVDTLNAGENRDYKIIQEREKLVNKIRLLETDIQVYENNIGFIAKSSKSQTLITDMESKLKQAKQRLTLLQEKLKALDSII
ncbi:MAG: DUF349 domain-containing protein [Marinifilaceae bacterium]